MKASKQTCSERERVKFEIVCVLLLGDLQRELFFVTTYGSQILRSKYVIYYCKSNCKSKCQSHCGGVELP